MLLGIYIYIVLKYDFGLHAQEIKPQLVITFSKSQQEFVVLNYTLLGGPTPSHKLKRTH